MGREVLTLPWSEQSVQMRTESPEEEKTQLELCTNSDPAAPTENIKHVLLKDLLRNVHP